MWFKMDLAVTRSWAADRGTWLRAPSRVFFLTATVSFSHKERWAIDAHNLFHHVIFDRTPPWYFPALREAERARERALRDGTRFEWPWYVPPSVPPEWVVTVARLLENPCITVTFDMADELDDFEPRMLTAFAGFKRFLTGYASRPETVHWRL